MHLPYDPAVKNKRNKNICSHTCGCQGEGGGGGMGWEVGVIIYRIDKQQGPTVWYRKLYSASYDKP